MGFRLEEGILSGWSRDDGGGKMFALGGGSVGGVWGWGLKVERAKRDQKGGVWCG